MGQVLHGCATTTEAGRRAIHHSQESLRGLTPYAFICRAWTTEPSRFTLNPPHQMPRLNI